MACIQRVALLAFQACAQAFSKLRNGILNGESRSHRAVSDQQTWRAEYRRLRVAAQGLRDNRQMVLKFILEREDLKKLVFTFFKADKQNIAFIGASPQIEIRGPHDWLGMCATLRIEIMNLKHELNEIHLFLQRNPDVKASFAEHLDKMETHARQRMRASISWNP